MCVYLYVCMYMSYLHGMLCFEIVHSMEGQEIWKQNGRKFYVNKNHAMVKEVKNKVTGVTGYEDVEDWDSDEEE